MNKLKKIIFDIEIIIDHKYPFNGETISSHMVLRGIDLIELEKLIRLNEIPNDSNLRITFNIRGVNY